MPDLVLIVTLRAHNGKSEALGDALRHLQVLTRKEPGCANTELHRSPDDPDVWMAYDRWKGEEGLTAHMAQPYVADFVARMGELVKGAPDIQRFEHIGG
jgi:quinol monooxygenase YgiN